MISRGFFYFFIRSSILSYREDIWDDLYADRPFDKPNKDNLFVEIKKLSKNITLPKFATTGSAGLDLMADIETPTPLLPNSALLIPTGIAIHLKNNNYCALIYPRSGLGHKQGIILGNSVGVIDSDYTGEILVSLFNRSNEIFIIKPKMRIAQLVFTRIKQPEFVEVNEFIDTQRNAGGFGSTGE